MYFSDVCLITEDVTTLTKFYEVILHAKAEGDYVHAIIYTEGTGLTIYSKKAAESDMKFDFSSFWGSGNITLSFDVDDIDVEYERLKAFDVKFVTVPTTYPWGVRSVHFRDPDGNIICFRSKSK
ncbi:VOC family protein [Paenibacillus azoreducens]|uniref:Glyoxalase n=1 Tax=Paenibacillus azoreducens TaxID=116718 RepID=A0A919YDS5_9BACL|nr:VOC family protein [Paenibacillus azoreducens]GIO46950.1 glyoxalase [Paenibacillus azoreducens]